MSPLKTFYGRFYILLTDQISSSGLSLLREVLGNMSIETVCQSGCNVMNFEIKLFEIFLIKLFFQRDRKFKTKM